MLDESETWQRNKWWLFDRVVESIHYDASEAADSDLVTKIVCTDGEVIEADEVVLTTPLGVLKSDAIDFDPPLPGWKQGAIERMGFGLLKKVSSRDFVTRSFCSRSLSTRSSSFTTNPSGTRVVTCLVC